MSLSNAIDYKKVGFRWKGTYSASSTYENGDVVHKEGAAWKFNSSTGNFEIFARGNIDSLVKGEIITGGNYTTTGVAGEVLVVDSAASKVEFNHRMDRNGQRVVSMASSGISEGYRMGRIEMCGYFNKTFVMNDGTVRGVGHDGSGELGVGSVDGDVGYTPNIIPFPPGIRIKKAFTGAYSNFFIDTDDRLWGTGYYQGLGMNTSTYQAHTLAYSSNYLEIPLCLHEVLPTVFTSTDKIVAVVAYYDHYYGYYGTFAFSDVGKVWAWGHNGSGSLGVGHENNVWDAAVVPISESVPMNGVTHSPWGAYTGLRSVDGHYYVAGEGDANWLKSKKTTFTKLEAAGKIKMAHVTSVVSHHASNYARYYLHGVVLENGDVYVTGNNPDQTGWGQTGETTSYTYDINNAVIGDRRYLLATGMRRIYLWSGGYHEMLAQEESSGEWRHRGYTGYGTGSQWGNVNSLPNHVNDFLTDNKYKMNPTYWNNNLTKVIAFGYNIYRIVGCLDSQGRIHISGFNNRGERGLGHNLSAYGESSYYYVNGGAKSNYYTDNDQAMPETYPYVQSTQTFVDFEASGRLAYHYSNNIYQHNSWYALTDKGDIYCWGASGHHCFANGGNDNQHVPTKLIF